MEIELKNRRGDVVGVALIDDDDASLVAGYKWRPLLSGKCTQYAEAKIGTPRRTVVMHRLILGVESVSYPLVDHINGDGLDNRRSNLRLVSAAENQQNRRGPSKNSHSDVLNVVLQRPRRDGSPARWRARCTVNGVRHQVGNFDTKEEAEEAVISWRREHSPFATI